MSQEDIAFLGTGWSFPPEFRRGTDDTSMSSGEKDIEESLKILLSTQLGERIMIPEYGCDLTELIFSPLDLTLKTFVSDLIRTAILYYEPRINVEKINIDTVNEIEGELILEVDYIIRATNSRRNIVFPFYRNEGTDV
ncbi:MAG: GPW/gp25 family protein [bacterium]|nr:GPW/gp25 family protein [bacterium]